MRSFLLWVNNNHLTGLRVWLEPNSWTSNVYFILEYNILFTLSIMQANNKLPAIIILIDVIVGGL